MADSLKEGGGAYATSYEAGRRLRQSVDRMRNVAIGSLGSRGDIFPTQRGVGTPAPAKSRVDVPLRVPRARTAGERDATTRNTQVGSLAARTQRRMRGAQQDSVVVEVPKEKLGGFYFWFVAGIAMIKDIVVDPVMGFLVTAGLGVSTTIVGSVIGLPLAGMAWLIKILYLVMFFMAASFYFMNHGGVHESLRTVKLIIWVLGGITAVIPVVSSLPEATFMFFSVAYLENKMRSSETVSEIVHTTMRFAHVK